MGDIGKPGRLCGLYFDHMLDFSNIFRARE